MKELGNTPEDNFTTFIPTADEFNLLISGDSRLKNFSWSFAKKSEFVVPTNGRAYNIIKRVAEQKNITIENS